MSKYKNRKTALYQHILIFDGRRLQDIDEGQMDVMRALVMGGYITYDESVDGMLLRVTELGEEVLSRE